MPREKYSQTEEHRYNVFLSHNRDDQKAVFKIAKKLKQAGLKPWLDEWCAIPGGDWQDNLSEGLRSASACAVFIGPHGIGSWEKLEYKVATDRMARDYGFRVFLVLLPDLAEPFCPTNLPCFLTTRSWVDFRRGCNDEVAFQSLVNAIKGIPNGPSVSIDTRQDVCPYRGLQIFDEEHSEYFFGRSADVQRLLEKLKATRFLAVIGQSGTGKSSLVRAGLIPALRNEALPESNEWTTRVFRPGAHPLVAMASHLLRLYPQDSMQKTLNQMNSDGRTLHLAVSIAEAASPPGKRILWVIDQFEEVFTLCSDAQERKHFIDNLLFASAVPDGRSMVIITMRADFYPKCVFYPDLAARIAALQFLVSPLDITSLRQAIEEPVRLVSLEFEEGLVETILDDVVNQPGALPLLQHALLELWERRRGRMLSLEAYRESGGVKEAIAWRAETVYNQFTADQQEIVQPILLRLTQPGEDTEDTRRRAAMDELVTISEKKVNVEDVVRQMVKARLLTTSADPETGSCWVDVCHEALIRSWEKLQDWIEKDREGLRLHRHLSEAACDWQRPDHDESMLYRGLRLAQALEWRKQNEGSLNELEIEFLKASEILKNNEEEKEKEQQRRELEAAQQLTAIEKRRTETAQALVMSERKARLRQLYFTLGVALLFLIAAGIAIYANYQKKIAHSRELASQSYNQLSIDPELSAALANEAISESHTDEAERALRNALAAYQESRMRALFHGHEASVRYAAFSTDGKKIATASEDKSVRVWDAATGITILELNQEDGHDDYVYSSVFSPDDSRILTASKDSTVRMWDAKSGHLLFNLRGHEGPVRHATFSPDGTRIVTASEDKTVRIWDSSSGRLLFELDQKNRHEAKVYSALFSSDGKKIVTASKDRTARLWDAETGEMLLSISGHEGSVRYADFHPDGKYIITASTDNKARVWNIESGKLMLTIDKHSDWIHTATFSHNGGVIATASKDKTVRIWDAETGESLFELSRHKGSINSLAFSPDSRFIVTSSGDQTARVWEVKVEPRLVELGDKMIYKSALRCASFSLSGNLAVTAGEYRIATVWDLRNHNPPVSLKGHSGWITSATFSQKGDRIVTASGDKTARIWDTKTGRMLLKLDGHKSWIYSATFSSDDEIIATSGKNNTACVWDAQTGRRLLKLTGHNGRVLSVAFSAKDDRIVTASEDKTARVWDRKTGKMLVKLIGHRNWVTSATFSQQGDRIVTASGDKTARVWDAKTGEMIVELVGHKGWIFSAKFCPRSERIVTASRDRTACLWDARTGHRIVELLGHEGWVYSAEFNPKGNSIITASEDKTARIFRHELCCSFKKLVECAQKIRKLMPEERQKYLHEDSKPKLHLF